MNQCASGLADLVIEEQETRKQLQQQNQMTSGLQFPLNTSLFSSQQQPIQPVQKPPTTVEPSRFYNSYLHQNTYLKYNQLREYAKEALKSSNWPVDGGPPPGLNLNGFK